MFSLKNGKFISKKTCKQLLPVGGLSQKIGQDWLKKKKRKRKEKKETDLKKWAGLNQKIWED